MSATGAESLNVEDNGIADAITHFTGTVTPMIGMLGTRPISGKVDGLECMAGWVLPEQDGYPYKRVMIKRGEEFYLISEGDPSTVYTQIDGQEAPLTDDNTPASDIIRTDLVRILNVLVESQAEA